MIYDVLKILSCICTALVLGKIVQKIGLLSVLGWLITGILLGPFAANIVTSKIIYENHLYEFILVIAEVLVS